MHLRFLASFTTCRSTLTSFSYSFALALNLLSLCSDRDPQYGSANERVIVRETAIGTVKDTGKSAPFLFFNQFVMGQDGLASNATWIIIDSLVVSG